MQERYMKLAIQEAKKGFGKTFTNPLVGAVIVNNQEVIATGAHLEYGRAHAEKNALLSCDAPEKLFNSTIYVTLEPCNHYGKQPPCTQLIIESGIKCVIIGQLDPNPLVAGKGKATLEKSGIGVITGILEKEVRALNPFYNYYFENKRPYIVLKQATTLDGKLSLFLQRTKITSKAVYERVHKERNHYQSILVGSQTILTDNPLLLGTSEATFPPIRIILDRRGRVLKRLDLKIFHNDVSPVWIFTEQVTNKKLLPNHVEVIFQKNVTIPSIVEELERRKIQSVYVEGGAQIHDTFLRSGYWDELITYLSFKVIGGNGVCAISSSKQAHQVIELVDISIERIGKDLRISGRRC